MRIRLASDRSDAKPLMDDGAREVILEKSFEQIYARQLIEDKSCTPPSYYLLFVCVLVVVVVFWLFQPCSFARCSREGGSVLKSHYSFGTNLQWCPERLRGLQRVSRTNPPPVKDALRFVKIDLKRAARNVSA